MQGPKLEKERYVGMALDFKKIMADALLELCETKPLKSIKISDITAHTGISCQTFYNHFKSKSDLINWIYRERIVVPQEPSSSKKVDLYASMIFFYKSLKKYESFIQQVCKIEGEAGIKKCIENLETRWSDRYYKKFFEDGVVPQNVGFAIHYGSYAFIGVTIRWITSGMQETPHMMAMGRVDCLPRELREFFLNDTRPETLVVDRHVFAHTARNEPVRKEEGTAIVANKTRFSDAILVLCENKPLSKITIGDLLEKTGAGRQTFYRYFLDKNDLVQWTFLNKILYLSPDGKDFYYCWLEYYTQLTQHRNFLAQAGAVIGQNCLFNYMLECSENWYQKQYYNYYGEKNLPRDVAYAVRFHAYGVVSSIIDWAKSGEEISPETLALWTCNCIPGPLRAYPFIRDLFEQLIEN